MDHVLSATKVTTDTQSAEGPKRLKHKKNRFPFGKMALTALWHYKTKGFC
jgi:hypothetical protein